MSKKPAIIKMRKAQDIDVPIDVIGIKNKKGESVFKQPTDDERERAILKKENDEQKTKETARENKRSDFKKGRDEVREKKTEAEKAEAEKAAKAEKAAEAEKVEAAKAAEEANAAKKEETRAIEEKALNEIGESKDIVVASYNMSFASDRGIYKGIECRDISCDNLFPGEVNFLKNATKPREFFDNARQKLFDFILAAKPTIVGLQEMIFLPEKEEQSDMKNIKIMNFEQNPQPITTAGYNEIKDWLKGGTGDKDDAKGKDDTESKIKSKYEIVKATTVKPPKKGGEADYTSNVTIFDKTKLGELVMPKGWNELAKDGPDNALSNPTLPYVRDMGKGGRPFSMIVTSGGYIIVNVHAPKVDNDNVKNAEKVRDELQNLFSKALTHYLEWSLTAEDKNNSPFKVNTSKIFFVGDFNDQWHTINANKPLKFGKGTGANEISLTTGLDEKDGIKSCCYNWDSCCKVSDTDNNEGTNPVKYDPEKKISCQDKLPKGKDKKSMEERGNVDNYIFTGDYCLGQHVKTKLQMYKGSPSYYDEKTGASKASDHELVWASFTTDDKNIEGGADNDKYNPITINWVRHSESIANLIDIEITKTPDMYIKDSDDYNGYRTYRNDFIADEGKNYEPFTEEIKAKITQLKENENFKEICKKDKKDKMCSDSERMVKFIDDKGEMIKFNDLEKQGVKPLPKTPGTWMFTPTLSYAGVIQSLVFGKTYLNLITDESNSENKSTKQQYDRICCSGSVRTIMTMLISLIAANRDDLIIAPAPAAPAAPVAPAQTEVFIYPYITEALNGGKFIDADLSNEAIHPKLIGEIVKTIVTWLVEKLLLVVDDQTLKTKYLEGITIAQAPAEQVQAQAEQAQAQAQAPDNKVSFTITKTGAAKTITINFNEYAKLSERPLSDTKKFIDFLKVGEKSVIEGGAVEQESPPKVPALIKKFEGMNKPTLPNNLKKGPPSAVNTAAVPAVPVPAAPVAAPVPVTAAPVAAPAATTTTTTTTEPIAQPATAVTTEPKPLKILAFSHGININSRRFANEPSVNENTPFPNNCSLWEETFKFNPILEDYYPYGITTYKKEKDGKYDVIKNKFDYDENGKLKPNFIAPDNFKGSDVRKDNLITALNEGDNFSKNNFGALKADTLRYDVNEILWNERKWTWPGVAPPQGGGGGKRINRKVYYKNKKYTRRKNMLRKNKSIRKNKSKGKSSLRRRRRNRLANSKKTKKHYRIKKAKYTKRA